MQDYSTLKTQILNDISKNKDVSQSVNILKSKLKNETVKYSDAVKFSRAMAKATSKSLSSSIELNSIEEDMTGFAEKVVVPVYKSAQKSVLSASKQVQTTLNKKSKLGLKPVDIEPDESRLKHIVERFKEAESIDTVSFLLGEDVIENILHSAVTDTIRGNAKRFEDAGFKTYITRTDGTGCCDWCSSMVGTYTFNNLPDDFWAVHKGCSCEFEYHANGKHDRITFSSNMEKKTESI